LETFDNPAPYTQRAFGVRVATKRKPIALVFAKDKQAEYLAPYFGSGRQLLLGKRGLPVPIDIRTNQYDNLPKGTIKRLKGRTDVFFGRVKTKNGRIISGIWQRPSAKAGRPAKRVSKGKAAPRTGPLKLLVEWTDGTTVNQRLPFRSRAEQIVNKFASVELAKAIAWAIKTAK
jgi:hypothetical protein